jgi:hypothetical protein
MARRPCHLFSTNAYVRVATTTVYSLGLRVDGIKYCYLSVSNHAITAGNTRCLIVPSRITNMPYQSIASGSNHKVHNVTICSDGVA